MFDLPFCFPPDEMTSFLTDRGYAPAYSAATGEPELSNVVIWEDPTTGNWFLISRVVSDYSACALMWGVGFTSLH